MISITNQTITRNVIGAHMSKRLFSHPTSQRANDIKNNKWKWRNNFRIKKFHKLSNNLTFFFFLFSREIFRIHSENHNVLNAL